jgi:hypothetical protein
MRLAIDANYNVRKLATIDPARVYRLRLLRRRACGQHARRLLRRHLFPGTICCMGVNFYTDVATLDGKQTFRLGYLPHDDFVKIAKKQCRYVLITGEKDFNLPTPRPS